jgi:hypothetical protein
MPIGTQAKIVARSAADVIATDVASKRPSLEENGNDFTGKDPDDEGSANAEKHDPLQCIADQPGHARPILRYGCCEQHRIYDVCDGQPEHGDDDIRHRSTIVEG